jgi:hypothetical protein
MNPSKFKIGLRFGIFTSLLSFLVGIALVYTGLTDYSGSSNGWVSTLIMGLGIYLATEAFKKETGGTMEHGEIISVSLWLGLVSGVISAVLSIIHLQMDPKLVEQAKNLAEVRLEQQNMSDEMISKNMEIIDTMFQPIPLAALVLFVTLLSVLIIGAILGFFLKKERNVFDV